MSNDEALEHLRQIRLSRRTVKQKPKSVVKKAETKAKTNKAIDSISAEQAAKLLKLLEGDLS